MATMETLPEEVVLRILGLLRCPLTLLDVVPRVCRLWHRLSKEPLAWASAELSWDGKDPKARESGWGWEWDEPEDCVRVSTADAARVLLHAPALSSLNFYADMPKKGMKRLVNALKRSRTIVTDYFTVQEQTSWHMTLRGREALLDMLWRSRDRLTRATVQLSRQEMVSEDVPASKRGVLRDSQGRSVLEVLAHMSRLECLSLDASWDYPYAGHLKDKLPRLRKLFFNRGEGDVSGERLVRDLIDGAADSLRALDLNRGYGRRQDEFARLCPGIPDLRAAVTPTLLASVAACKRLTFLEGPAACAEHLAGLPEIAELVLHLYPDKGRAEEAIRGVLDACGRVATLTLLELWVTRDADEQCFLNGARWEVHKREQLRCKKLARDFKEKHPDLEFNFNFEQ